MRIGWVNEKTDQNCPWHHLMQDLKLLCLHCAGQGGDAGDVAAWPLKARDLTFPCQGHRTHLR